MENIEQSEGTTLEPVSPADLSDSELDSVLSAPEGDEETQDEPEDNSDNAEESSQEEDSSPEDWKAKYEKLREESEKREAHLRQVELWNKRQANELGETRKKLKEAIEAKRAGLDEKFLEKPTEAMRDLEEIRAAEEELTELDQQEALQYHQQEAFQVVSANVKKEEFDIEAMTESLRADGLSEDFVNTFQRNPFAMARGETLVHLAKRSLAEKRLKELMGYTQKLHAAYEQLQKKPKDILQNLEKVSRQTPSVTSSNGGVSKNGRPSSKSLAMMTDAELEESLALNRV